MKVYIINAHDYEYDFWTGVLYVTLDKDKAESMKTRFEEIDKDDEYGCYEYSIEEYDTDKDYWKGKNNETR